MPVNAAPGLPPGFDLDSLVGGWPDEWVDPEPFRTLAEAEPHRDHVARLCATLESQETCSRIMRHNGPKDMRAILEGTARAAAAVGATMTPRVASYAVHLGLKTT